MVTSFFQSVLLLQPIKVVLAAVMVALCVKKASDTEGNGNDDLVIKRLKTEPQSRIGNAMELEKRIQAIGQPPGKIKKFYRSVYFLY